MKVLMISGDPGVLDPQSVAGKRMIEYGQVLGELDILLCRGSFLKFFAGFLYGFEKIGRSKPDVITAQDMEHSLLAWIYSTVYKIPWQMQIHTDIFSPYFVRSSVFNKIRVWLAKFLLLRADGVRVVSERIRNSILWTSDVHMDIGCPITVLPIFVDIEKIKNIPIKTDLHQKYGKDKFIILMASRITKEKNIRLALEALSSLIRANKRIVFLIFGDGPEIENLKHDASPNIFFEPYTNDLVSYYKTCDLFLLTSNYEGYGMTLVEAAATGAKIVSSDVGIAPEILEAENIFKVGDREDLRSRLEAAIEGKIKPARPLKTQTKQEYLRLYKESLEQCLK